MAVTSQGNRCSATMNLALSVLCVLLLGHCSANMINTNVDDTDRLRVLIDTDDVKLTCTADKLKGEFVWERSVEGSLPGPLPTDDRFKTKGGELTISEPTEMDAANYTCKFAVSNGASNLNATIQIVTNVTVRMTGKSINKQEGDDLTITCRAYGKPTPTITWTKNAKDIFTIYNITSRLTLGPNTDSVPQAQLGLRTLVRPDDAGDYCCHAENVANSASQCIIVRVKDKYGALWPFIGIVCEVVVLTAIIYIYEKKSKPDMDDSDTDHNNDRPAQSKGDVRQRK